MIRISWEKIDSNLDKKIKYNYLSIKKLQVSLSNLTLTFFIVYKPKLRNRK